MKPIKPVAGLPPRQTGNTNADGQLLRLWLQRALQIHDENAQEIAKRLKELDDAISSGVVPTKEPGKDGITPHIGANGNWWIGDTDTGQPSRGYTPQKGTDYWLPSEIEGITQDVRDMLWADISGMSTTRRNLCYSTAVTSYQFASSGESAVRVTDYVWSCVKIARTSGLQISGSIFAAGETYTLSYKVKKTSGTLSVIGGHKAGTTTLAMYIDGTPLADLEADAFNVANDALEHFVEHTFKVTDAAEFTHMYIQPNRNTTTQIGFNVWDIKVENGTGATYWTPAPEDMTTVDTIAKLEARVAALEAKA